MRVAIGPPKNDAPLVIDPDRMVSRKITPQPFEAIAWRQKQVFEPVRRVHHF
jgi:hypothetical protein